MRNGGRNGRRARRAFGALIVAAFSLLAAAPVEAQLLPNGFFDNQPKIGGDNVAVTADRLTYNADTRQVLADGKVQVNYQNYVIDGSHLVFDQKTRIAHFVGDVVVHAPDGNVYRAPDMVLNGPMSQALMRNLSITTPQGGLVTAGNGNLETGRQTVLDDATYSPCGKCIDAKGHRIGWSTKANRMIYDSKTYNITLTQPSIYLLGIPVAWLPWLSLPDPTKRMSHLEFPSFDSSPQMGAKVSLPYFIADGPDTDIILTPSYMTRQGGMMEVELDHRFTNGAVQVKTWGVYQRDPSAFAPYSGADHTWRGAFQASGQFMPTKEWTVGWSYTGFTDPGFFTDYRINTDKSATNEIYATKLTRDEFLNFRLQQFNLLGDMTTADANAAPEKQALALPNATYRKYLQLPGDNGQVDLSGSLLGVVRGADDVRLNLPYPTPQTVPYVYGYAGTKVHTMAEADWQKQYILGGFAVTPFLGLRGDYAAFDSSATAISAPGTQSLFTATPIAAVDVRYPMISRNPGVTQVVEPIAQLVYRGSDVTDVGITNDDSQSFIFEDSNLFSYNRFDGADRQETGLRANLGAHYQANFDNGSWLDVIGGQSFQLAGVNAFGTFDPTEVTTGEGLSDAASYMVLGATGSFIPGLTMGAKVQYDAHAGAVTRGGVGTDYQINGYDASLNYLYVAPNLDRGVVTQQQEVEAGLSFPIPYVDYWRGNVYGGWDLAANKWLVAGAGAHYDDGYLSYGGDVSATGPTNTTPNDLRFTVSLLLKGLGGSGI